MKIKESLKVKSENITMYNSTGTAMQWVWAKDDGALNFALRRFVIQPRSQIGIHDHREEHEIFVLSGEGTVFDDSGHKQNIKANDTLYVPPNEPHGYSNTGNYDLLFLCIIPLK
ncbi:MAG: cupin domain-containing protein [Candidatus Hodarchaeales archaeon]|jgi:quercetin dioxygenase-like cupin family protein